MTDPSGYYDQSLPPSLLMGRGRAGRSSAPAGGGPAAAAPAGAGTTTLTAGPDGYTPAVKAVDRPKNLQELAARVRPAVLEPWPQGASVPVGARGKRAHWTGTEWKGGASPGCVLEEQPAEQLESSAVLEGQPQAVVTTPDGQQVSGVLEQPAPWNASQAAGSDSSAPAGDDGSAAGPRDASSPPAGEGGAVPTAAESPSPGSTQFPGSEAPGDLTR